ncbi:ribonuclease P protein component [Chitinophagaceae bacterium MMS25-I14]
MRNTFKAYERLKREQHIDTLFRKGKAFSVFPLKCICLPVARPEKASPVQVGFSVPKKKFRHSVDRHRVRRMVFEAWRLQKQELYDAIPATLQLHIFLIFTHTAQPDIEQAKTAVHGCIRKLIKEFAAPKPADA